MKTAIETATLAIKTAIEHPFPLKEDVLSKVLTGFSGKKILRLLQELVNSKEQNPQQVYLEVGVFQGMTLLSTAHATSIPCFGIDNFNFFDPDKKNRSIIEQRRTQLGIENAHLINLDYEDALADLPQQIGKNQQIAVYFIDGPHDYRSQLMCLQLALPYLTEGAVIVVDDCNYQHVRQANRDFLVTHPEFKLLFESYTPCHPMNMTVAQKEAATQGWWDGINVLIHDPTDSLPRNYPPTERSRTLFENDHLIHSAEYGLSAIHALNASNYLSKLNFKKALIEWQRFRRARRGNFSFAHSNTFSEGLPQEHLIG